jgi:hypothetical protein
MTSNFLTESELKAKDNAIREQFAQRVTNAPTLQIGDKVYNSDYKITGTVVEFAAPFMSCPCVRIEFATRTLDTLEPMTDHRTFMTCDLAKVA